jgi:hypothetical protein
MKKEWSKSMKKFLALLLSFCMLLSLCIVTASADPTDSATVTDETELTTALANSSISTIKLGSDITLTSTLKITDGKSITLDLNGHTLSRSQLVIEVLHGSLNVTGTGVIQELTDNGFAPILIKGSTDVADTNYSTVTVGKDVTLKGWSGLFVDTNYGKACGVTINLAGTIISPAADTHTTAGNAIYINGTIKDTVNYPQITIEATAKVTANRAEGTAIYAAGYAKWNIKGGTFTGSSCIELKAGEMNITGGVFAATGKYVHSANGNGSSTDGCAVSLVENKSYGIPRSITVTGGSFTGPVGIVDDDADTSNNVGKLIISGGYFTANPSAYLANGKAALASDKSGYSFMVGTAKEDVKVVTGEPEVKPITATDLTPAEIKSLDQTAKTVAPDPTDTGLVTTAGQIAQTTTTTAEDAKTALNAVAIPTTGAKVTVVIQPKLVVTPVDIDTTSNILTLDIKATYDTIATTDPNDINLEGNAKNAVKMGETKDLDVKDGTPVVITCQIPEAMALKGGHMVDSLTVKHVKENGTVYYYTATVTAQQTQDGTLYYATFTVTHGFSEFQLMAANTGTLNVKYSADTTKTYGVTDVNQAKLPAAPEKTGYTFTGWSFEGVNGTYTTLTAALWDALMTNVTGAKNVTATPQYKAVTTAPTTPTAPSPNTGDSSSMVLFAALLVVSALGMGIVMVSGRKTGKRCK